MIRDFCRERNQLLVLKSILSGEALENKDVNASLQNNRISFPWLKKLEFNALFHLIIKIIYNPLMLNKTMKM